MYSEDRQVYVSSVIAQPLESYYFEIITEREVLISTPVIVPTKPVLIEVTKTQDERQTNIRFIDSVRTRDFYAYELFFDFLNQDGFVFFSSITPIYSQLARCRYYESGMFREGATFADICLSEGENEIILDAQVDGVNASFTFNLYALSEDLFLYSKSLSELESSSFQDASVDPTRVHSNISNGYGLVGAFNFQDTIVIFNQTQ